MTTFLLAIALLVGAWALIEGARTRRIIKRTQELNRDTARLLRGEDR